MQVGTAVIGTLLGAGLGAAVGGGRGAAIGAGAGALGGTLVGAGPSQQANYSLQQRYDLAYSQCMYTRGNQVPGYQPPPGYASAPPQDYPPQAAPSQGYPPPQGYQPPPGLSAPPGVSAAAPGLSAPPGISAAATGLSAASRLSAVALIGTAWALHRRFARYLQPPDAQDLQRPCALNRLGRPCAGHPRLAVPIAAEGVEGGPAAATADRHNYPRGTLSLGLSTASAPFRSALHNASLPRMACVPPALRTACPRSAPSGPGGSAPPRRPRPACPRSAPR